MKRGNLIKIITALSLAVFVSNCNPDKKIPINTRINLNNQIKQEQKIQTLEEKADYFEKDLENHLSEEGLCLYKLYRTEHIINGESYEPRYSALGDAAYMTGCLLGAESLRYQATNNKQEKQDAKEKLEKLVNGLHILQEVTGQKGYLARAFCKKQQAGEKELEEFLEGKGKYKDYLWKGDTSKDQYTAVMFGYSLACEAVKDTDEKEMQKIRQIIREDVENIADMLIENNFQIIGEEGKTSYGSLTPRVPNIPLINIPIGLNALHQLTWMKIAENITGQEKFRKAYDKLIEKNFHKIATKGFYDKPWPLKEVDYVNNNMAFLDFYNILKLKPRKQRYYEKALKERYEELEQQKNPFWNFIYACYCEDKEDKKEKTEAIKEGLETLQQFPITPAYSFDWRINEQEEQYKKYSGTAFLVTYWLARKHKFISEE